MTEPNCPSVSAHTHTHTYIYIHTHKARVFFIIILVSFFSFLFRTQNRAIKFSLLGTHRGTTGVTCKYSVYNPFFFNLRIEMLHS